uniref:cAMP-dependent protein kinase inhibitor gamma n=1 Tax=Salvator merianae TaxID=96440 RepID=A0A8D0BG14_SALMN
MMETEAAYSDFISCDRSGRRNAIHDLRGDASSLKLEKLASTMGAIAVTEEGETLQLTSLPVLIPCMLKSWPLRMPLYRIAS